MAIRAYVLVGVEVGRANSVLKAIQELNYTGVRVIAADAVTGPHDVIVHLEADDLDRLASTVTEALQGIRGVQRTITCLAVRLA